ncbi:hypothetical protein KR067_004348, partial [Drosophila pandora]
MSHLPLDARAILQHLNELGYRNITAEQLREFLKDLRKLIKYEERLAENAKENNFSSLHKRSTASSRAKLTGDRDRDKDKENSAPATTSSSLFVKEKEFKTDREDPRSEAGADFDDLARLFREKLLMDASIPPVVPKQSTKQTMAKSEPVSRRRSRSSLRSGRQPPPSSGESEPNAGERPRAQRRRRSRSRARSASRGSLTGRRKNRHTDPVALYQYYQKEWAHFRGQIPGELPKLSSRFGARH